LKNKFNPPRITVITIAGSFRINFRIAVTINSFLLDEGFLLLTQREGRLDHLLVLNNLAQFLIQKN